MPRLRLALLQSNPVVGDLLGNSEQIFRAAQRAAAESADILITGEMALSGYPIEDLAARQDFLSDCTRAVTDLAERLAAAGLGELPVIVGHPSGPVPVVTAGQHTPSAIAQNSASVLQGGRVLGRYDKHHLPNYSVFDEYRIFVPGDGQLIVRVAGVDVGVLICEDLWRDSGPVTGFLAAGVGLLAVLNASPFERDKAEVRLPLVRRRAQQLSAPVAYINIVGGQDDLVFDGDSLVVGATGDVIARAPQFTEHLLVVEVDAAEAVSSTDFGTSLPQGVTHLTLSTTGRKEPAEEEDPESRMQPIAEPLEDSERLWHALVLGTRDYVEKNGFPSVVLGLSGGIDSAVCAAIAVDAIGADRVYGVSMPSRYSSEHSQRDAAELATAVGLHFEVEPIADLVRPVEEQLQLSGTAAENLQARIRGIILMAKSNSFGHLVLTTGNKTELAVGYSTIYGDSAGGFAPIKDVPKTLVWQLARWRNAEAERRGETPPIPENSITKPPSAELRPDQLDEDSLPPYDLLDALLEGYITQALGRDDLCALGFEASTVDTVIALVDRSEWKRRQGAIGPKISGMAFGRDRRLPITSRRTSAAT